MNGPCERQHSFRVDSKVLEWRRKTSKDFLSRRIEPEASPQPVSIVCGPSLQRGHSGSAEGSRRLA